MKSIVGYSTGVIDFPRKMAMTLFFAGCNLNCSFCYNRDVVHGEPLLSIDEVKAAFNNAQSAFNTLKLGVVFSGGEPTVNPCFKQGVAAFSGHPMAIHTNGLVVPDGEIVRQFDSVVLSLKTSKELRPSGLSFVDYVDAMREALSAYSSCKTKELRLVSAPERENEYEVALGHFRDSDSLNGWRVTRVQQL